jgi:hypothetical protein
VPLAALALMELRTRRLRRVFSLRTPRRRELVAAAVALALVPALVGVAAAQPVVIHRQAVTERVDAQVYIVFDTSLSMSARTGPHGPTRLARAKREAEALIPQLGNIPVGIATLTDRVLPSLLPTTGVPLVLRTVNQSVRIDEPPPSLRYHGRASTLESLAELEGDRIFPPGVEHPMLVVFTDGEEKAPPPFTGLSYAQQFAIPPFFVHVWAPTERHYVDGRIDPNYLPDPTSSSILAHVAALSHGRVFREGDVGGVLAAIRAKAGSKPSTTTLLGFRRVALGQWFLLGGVVPLAFLFWRRNL